MDLKLTNGFSQAQLKLLAVICMTLNHIAAIFRLPAQLAVLFTCSGMVAMPMFALFVSEGYHYTSNRFKYLNRLITAAIVSHFAFAYAFDVPFPFTSAIYTLTLAYLALMVLHTQKVPQYCKVIVIVGICGLSMIGDWSWCAVLWSVGFDLFRGNKTKQIISFMATGTLYAIFMMAATGLTPTAFAFLLAIPFIYFYNGTLGQMPKALRLGVYGYYPFHLILLKLLAQPQSWKSFIDIFF